MGWFTFNNAELGAAGTVDAGTRVDDWLLEKAGLGDTFLGDWARANNTYLAPAVYASQVKEDPKQSYSTAINAAADAGATPEELEAFAFAAGVHGENNGALGQAAKKTADQVFQKAKELAGELPTWLVVAGAAAGVVVGGYVVIQARRVFA